MTEISPTVQATSLALLALERATSKWLSAEIVALDTSVCDDMEAHVDESHEQEWCGWLTLAEQYARGER